MEESMEDKKMERFLKHHIMHILYTLITGTALGGLVVLVPLAAKTLFLAQELQRREMPNKLIDLIALGLLLGVFILLYMLWLSMELLLRNIKAVNDKIGNIHKRNEWNEKVKKEILEEKRMREKLYCDIIGGLKTPLSKDDEEALMCTLRETNISQLEEARQDLIRMRE